jgi:hypothetical protein
VRNLRRVVAMLFGLQALALGCYSPNIQDRGYSCGDSGACPAHFHCASNHLCYQGDASIEMPVVCNSVTNTTPLCSVPPAGNQACDPGCQTGCNGCGWCAVVNGTAKCLTGTAGSKDVGAICDPSLESDCAAGLYCQPECGTGRCYKFCDSGTTLCGAGSSCNVTAREPGDAGTTLPFALCGLLSTCDAVSQNGCDAPFACYPTGSTSPATVCECAGSFASGTSCFFTDQCARGDNCISFKTTNQSLCLQTCTSTGDCATGTTCMNQMPMYGYCM